MYLNKDPASLSLLGKSDLNAEIVAVQLTDSLVQYDERLEFRSLLPGRWPGPLQNGPTTSLLHRTHPHTA